MPKRFDRIQAALERKHPMERAEAAYVEQIGAATLDAFHADESRDGFTIIYREKAFLWVEDDRTKASYAVPYVVGKNGEITIAARAQWERVEVEFADPKAKGVATASKAADKAAATGAKKALAADYLTVTEQDLAAREARLKAARQAQADANVAETERRRFEREGPRRPPAPADALHVTVPETTDSEERGQKPHEVASAARHARRGQPRESAKATAEVSSDPLHLEASRRAANKGRKPEDQI